ncbi:MAG: hypothetical protein ACKPKO_53870 [Candidatus Fonsibacter sp.]
MIATALALQQATQEAVHDPMVLELAKDLFESRDVSEDEYIRKIFRYSALLASITATLATSVLLTESQIDEMMNTIKEMESMGKDLDNGNE